MERSDTSTEPLIPPFPLVRARQLAITGLVLSCLAAGVGLLVDGQSSSPGIISTFRLILVAVGVLAAGAALALRGDRWDLWLIAAGAIFAVSFGFPPHWDSGRTLAHVVGTLCLAGSALQALPRKTALSIASAVVLLHFGGIFIATTLPDPAPWLSSQLFVRGYSRYLLFVYLRNAYHFYSPEPGPASDLFILMNYELDEKDPATGKNKTLAEWYYLPRRDLHMRDPLGLTYYRRLSITEQVAGTIPDLFTPQSFEKLDARQRRVSAAVGLAGKEPIPLAPNDFEAEVNQYRVPRPDITRYLLPSYARHLAVERSAPGRTVKSMKIYRLEHRIVQTLPFAQGLDPFHPTGYRPYYLGEYAADPSDPTGKHWSLVDPEDPMLYWLVPILPKPGGRSPNDPNGKDFIDYLSRHAGYEVDWRRP